MAEHQRNGVDRDLGVRLDTRPGVEFGGRRRVVVARKKMLMAVQSSQEVRDHGLRLTNSEVAEVPYLVVRPNRLIPALDKSLVHRGD